MALVENINRDVDRLKLLMDTLNELPCHFYKSYYEAFPEREKSVRELVRDLEKLPSEYLTLISTVSIMLSKLYTDFTPIENDVVMEKFISIANRIEELKIIHQKEYEAITTLINLLRREVEIFRDLKTMCKY